MQGTMPEFLVFMAGIAVAIVCAILFVHWLGIPDVVHRFIALFVMAFAFAGWTHLPHGYMRRRRLRKAIGTE